jgi:hypothetical protein
MRSDAAFGRLEQFHLCGQATLRETNRTTRRDANRSFVRIVSPASNAITFCWRTTSACLSELALWNPDCFGSASQRYAPERRRAARPRPSASQRGRAHEQTLRDFLPRGAPGHRDEPEPGDGGRQPELVEGDDQAAVDSHRGHLPPLGERPRAPESGRGEARLVSIVAT